MASLKTNVALNLLNTLTSVVFPVVTFPYATRVLGTEGLGLVNFLGSVVNYLVLLTGIGIPMYAVKEVARHRSRPNLRNHCAVEIAMLNLFLCLLGYAVVALMAWFIPRIHEHQGLFWVLSLSIFFTAIGVNWFYQAIEDFTFITVRAIAFRFIAAIGLFVFVKSPSDLMAYCLVTVSLAVGNNIINFVHLRKYISIKSIAWRRLVLWRHVKPSLRIFLPNVITSIYGNLNIVMLGFMQTDAAVGIYSAGHKLVQIVLMMITSLSVVLLPRCSSLIEAKRQEEFASISRKTIHLIVASALPCLTGLVMLAHPLVTLFCGADFEAAYAVVQCSAPVLLIIGLSNVVGIQMLYPLGKEMIVVKSMVVGIVLNFALNLALVPFYSYVGAAVAGVLAELAVLGMLLWCGRKSLPFKLGDLQVRPYLLATLGMAVAVWCVVHCLPMSWLLAVLACVAGGVVYVALLGVMKDPLLCDVAGFVISKLRRK